MQFARIGDFFAVTHITGPKHNLLQVRLARGRQIEAPSCEVLPPVDGCTHPALDQELLVQQVLNGVATANARLGTDYVVTHIRRVQNDTGPEVLYAYLAKELVERVDQGGEFVITSA